MPYSALVDLVGVRELAADEPSAYVRHAQNFRTFLERAFDQRPTSRVYFFRDHCYVQDSEYDSLVAALQALQRELLFHAHLHIRAVIASGDIDAKALPIETAALGGRVAKRPSKATAAAQTQPQPVITGYAFNENAAKLFGDLETLKGIGLAIDEHVLPQPPSPSLAMENFFITEGRARRYHAFWDLKLTESAIAPESLAALIRNFRQSRAASRKVARFFVPPLVNWARNMNMAEGSVPTLDADIVYGRLGAFRDVTGVELVYLTLIDRIYSDAAKKYDVARVAALKGFFLKARWIHTLLRSHDYNTVPIPRSVLSNASRRAFITEVANYERKKKVEEPIEVTE